MSSSIEDELLKYLTQEIIRRRAVPIDTETPLISSGLVDSFALTDILAKLEDLTNMHIPAGKVQPKDMDTVRLMIAMVQRIGKPRC